MNFKHQLYCAWVCLYVTFECSAGDVAPNTRVQSDIYRIVNQLGKSQTQYMGAEELKALEQANTNRVNLYQQVLIFMRYSATNETLGIGGVLLADKISINKNEKVRAALPLLVSSDSQIREIASNVLRSVDKNRTNIYGVDFTVYEAFLRNADTNYTLALVRYLYERNANAAVLSASRVFSLGNQDNDTAEIAAKIAGSESESVAYFAARSEWWAHLYLVSVLEKNPALRSLELFEKIQQSDNSLVREQAHRVKPRKD